MENVHEGNEVCTKNAKGYFLMLVVICLYHSFSTMSDEHIGHKENRLLQRGIFSSSDFAAFQKSQVESIEYYHFLGNSTTSTIHENMYR